ncbi:MAG TPA: HEAT repeat domain-containing protein, partial [Holophagaceae bacterium]
QQALPELGARLLSPTASPGLKRSLYGLTAKFDWPEWVPHLAKALHQESDLGVFDEGCAALGRLELRSAREALLRLTAQRADPDRQLILRRELSALESQQPLPFYLGRLLEGEGNPRLAHQGARGLAALAEPGDLPLLTEALAGADPLAYRLLLRAVAELPCGEAGETLLGLFQDSLQTLRDYEELEGLTDRLPTVARTTARSELVDTLAARVESRAPEAFDDLRRALAAGEAANPLRPMERIRPLAEGPFETFLAEALVTLLEGKIARFSAMVTETQESSRKHRERTTAILDQICEGMVRLVAAGHLPRDRAFPALAAAFPAPPHTEGLDQAFCRLVNPGDEALEGILKVPEMRRRSACLDALGAREEDAFLPFFLRAMQDPIVDVGQRAIHHLGKLPSSAPTVLALLESGQIDQVRTAIRIFGENGTLAAAEPLMGFLRADARDDLLVEAVEALAAIRYPASAPLLLEMLHDGKPARLQEALVDALARIATPEAGLGLLHKAASLKLPPVLIVALEGALAAFPGFDHPFPEEELPALEHLLGRCCDDREGEGQRLRAILATQHLYCFDQALYARLKDRFSDFLFDLRT